MKCHGLVLLGLQLLWGHWIAKCVYMNIYTVYMYTCYTHHHWLDLFVKSIHLCEALKVEVDDEALEIIVEAYFLQGQGMVGEESEVESIQFLNVVRQRVKKVGSS